MGACVPVSIMGRLTSFIMADIMAEKSFRVP